MSNDLNISLPTPAGTMRVRIGPREIWAGKFPVRFGVLNGAVRWHLLQFQLQDTKYLVAEDTVGFARYTVGFSGIGDLGEICIRELLDEQFTALIITAPDSSEPLGWTPDEQEVINSQPDRESKLEVMHELANRKAAECDEISQWQEFVFNLFLKELLNDSQVVEALKVSSVHQHVSLHLEQVFKGYESITQVAVDEKEIDALYRLSDLELRQRIAKLVLNVDPIILEREARKPHGGFEIADMEIPVRLDHLEFYMCIPVKSGQEIREATVPEKISYQIFRPFLNFDKCGVVFVSAKRCSQNLMNAIKRMRDKLGWTIEVIEDAELAKLLKLNALL